MTVKVTTRLLQKNYAPTISVDEMPGAYIIKRIVPAPKSVRRDLVTLEVVPLHRPNAKSQFVLASSGRWRVEKDAWVFISKVRFGDCTAYVLR